MAHLPPKVPNILPPQHHQHQQQWHDFIHPHHQGPQNPPWVDEFMEFSAAKRGVHRRSVSESSVAFVEAGITGRSTRDSYMNNHNNNNNNNNNDDFDKFDDEQFLSMFSNELGGGSSSTSDHNSTNDEKKEAATMTSRGREEVESTCKGERDNEGKVQGQVGGEEGHNNNIGCSSNVANNVTLGGKGNAGEGDLDQQQPVVDPKRVKRILANRQSAQRSRVRKLQYISELERSVTALQSEVSALSPRVAFLDHQRMILNVDNSTLKAKIAALAQDKIFKDAHQEAMKREIERLRQVYYQQNLNKTESIVPPPSTSLIPTTSQPPPPDTENEQLTG